MVRSWLVVPVSSPGFSRAYILRDEEPDRLKAVLRAKQFVVAASAARVWGGMPVYTWRQLTPAQREELLDSRKQHHWPWHAPPHPDIQNALFHLTAANFEHQSIIGKNVRRLGEFEMELMSALAESEEKCIAWCVLPNHYHLLAEVADLKRTVKNLGQLHGRTSRRWNLQDGLIGRQCWYRCADRAIRSERHMWVVMNYIHNNPVKHGYAKRWQDWPFSSAAIFLESVGRVRAAAIWRDYPILDFGKGWDDFEVSKEERTGEPPEGPNTSTLFVVPPLVRSSGFSRVEFRIFMRQAGPPKGGTTSEESGQERDKLDTRRAHSESRSLPPLWGLILY